jgi:hypothetical protein
MNVLVDRLGLPLGLDLVPVVHQLKDEFYESDVRTTIADRQGGIRAISETPS